MLTLGLQDDPLKFLFTSIKLHEFKRSSLFRLWFLSLTIFNVMQFLVSLLSIFCWRSSPIFMDLRYLPHLGRTIMTINSCGFVILGHKIFMELPEIVAQHAWSLRSGGEKTYRRILKSCYSIKILHTSAYVVIFLGILSNAPFLERDKLWQPFVFLVHEYLGDWKLFFLTAYYLLFSIYMYSMLTILNTSNYIISHINFQYHILNHYVIRLAKLSVHNDRVGYQEAMYKEIVNLVQMHDKILKFSNKMLAYADIGMLALLFSIIQMFLCIAGFVIFNVQPADNLRMASSLIPMIVFAVNICSNGQRVKDESERVYYNLLECGWYNWNKKNRRAYLMLLTNNMTPMKFSKSGVLDVDYIHLTFICRTSYTLFTLFINMSGKEMKF